MRQLVAAALLVMPVLLIGCPRIAAQGNKTMIVRISEIEIDPAFLDDYKAVLKEESAASVKLEAGVICIFPMFEKDAPARVRILELYADREAYEAHLKTPHFIKYKETTLKMVKALRLVDMDVIDPTAMPLIFKKLKGGT